MNEEWRPVQGYEGLYEVSDFGRVRNAISGKILKPQKSNGYLYVGLCHAMRKYKRFSIHKLVANAFVPNPFNLNIINHKDENRENNNADNLEWCTSKYNNTYGNIAEKRKATLAKKWFAKRYSLNVDLLTVTTIYTGESIVVDLRKIPDEVLKSYCLEKN